VRQGWALFLHECRIMLRYRIVAAACLALLGYGLIFALVGESLSADAIAFLILTDPAMLGFAFAGLLHMTERQQGADLQLMLSGIGMLQRFAYRATLLGLLSVLAATAIALLFLGIRESATFILATASISVTYSALGVALAQVTQRVTTFFASAGLILGPLAATALLAYADTAIGLYWPFAAQLHALRTSLAEPVRSSGVEGILLAISIATAFACLLGAARFVERRPSI